MRVFDATHWYSDEPDMTQNVLVGLMDERESSLWNSAEWETDDEEEAGLEQMIRSFTNGIYGDDDFTYYLMPSDGVKGEEGEYVDIGDRGFILDYDITNYTKEF